MEQSPSREAKSSSPSQEFPAFHGTQRFITAFIGARHTNSIYQNNFIPLIYAHITLKIVRCF
jgi:hypothetical protein